MTNDEQRLLSALKALAASEMREPSKQLEAKLLTGLRRKRVNWPLPVAVGVAIAAAVLIAAVFRPIPEPATTLQSAATVPLPPQVVARPVEARPARAKPVQAKLPRRSRSSRTQASVIPVPLMRIPYTEALNATDRAQLVRVNMPAAQLLAWGFPLSGRDPDAWVNADVLVGEDGLARAVRLVR